MCLDGKKRESSLILSSEANPNSTFCLSECDMIELPPGILFKCNTLRKTVLDLSKNRLKEIRFSFPLLMNIYYFPSIFCSFLRQNVSLQFWETRKVTPQTQSNIYVAWKNWTYPIITSKACRPIYTKKHQHYEYWTWQITQNSVIWSR